MPRRKRKPGSRAYNTLVSPRELYDHDFFDWTRCNAALLRSGRFQDADIAHIAEEIEDMGKSQQNALQGRLEVLLVHLLKWQCQPGRRTASWQVTIDTQRDRISDLLEQMPSLRGSVQLNLPKAYFRAVRRASLETGLPRTTFPSNCPYSAAEILDESYLPE